MADVSISLNYALGIFNLIPLPPLDGSKIIESFLPSKPPASTSRIAQYSFFILMALAVDGRACVFCSVPINS